MISINWCLFLCFGLGISGFILGYIANSDTDHYDQL